MISRFEQANRRKRMVGPTLISTSPTSTSSTALVTSSSPGPTPDRTVGIIVIKAGSRQEAKAIADEDPFHSEGVRKYEMLEWEIHQVLGAGPFSIAVQAALASNHAC